MDAFYDSLNSLNKYSMKSTHRKEKELQLHKTAVMCSFSKSAERKAEDLYKKYLSVASFHLVGVVGNQIKNLSKQLAYMEIQENRFNRFFTNKKFWKEVEDALYAKFG